MKANELRIGNYVLAADNVFGEVFAIVGVKILLLNYPYTDIITFTQPVDLLKGIPLTDDWLINSGFMLTANGGIQHFKFHNVDIEYNGLVYYYGTLTMLTYVHQLQNLYFALTGEELTIKNS